jgi:hypothetical protein
MSPVRVHTPGPTRLPKDFLDELAFELDASRREVDRQVERLAALCELQRAAAAAVRDLRRPITIVDVLAAGRDQPDRDRLSELARRLRGGG